MQRLSVLFLLLITAAWLSSCDNPPPAPETAGRPPLDSLPVFRLRAEQYAKTLTLPAELLPFERTELYAKTPAYVREVRVDIGDQAGQGSLLVALESPELGAQLAEAEARLQEARARLSASQDRLGRLQQAAREEGVVAAIELERARGDMQADSAAFMAARSTIDYYREMDRYLTIHAPFAGAITQRYADPGAFVGPGRSNSPLLVLENMTRLRLRVPVPEAYAAAPPEPDPIVFQVDAYPGRNFQASYARQAGAIDPHTRTELWEYEYDNTGRLLKPGMYATATLNLSRSTPGFWGPHSALVTSLERKFVIRVRNGATEWVDVQQGFTLPERIELIGPLAEGDTLLLRGSEEFLPGYRAVWVLERD